MTYLCERVVPHWRDRGAIVERVGVEADSAIAAVAQFRRAPEQDCLVRAFPYDAACVRLPAGDSFLWAEPADGRRRTATGRANRAKVCAV